MSTATKRKAEPSSSEDESEVKIASKKGKAEESIVSELEDNDERKECYFSVALLNGEYPPCCVICDAQADGMDLIKCWKCLKFFHFSSAERLTCDDSDTGKCVKCGNICCGVEDCTEDINQPYDDISYICRICVNDDVLWEDMICNDASFTEQMRITHPGREEQERQIKETTTRTTMRTTTRTTTRTNNNS